MANSCPPLTFLRPILLSLCVLQTASVCAEDYFSRREHHWNLQGDAVFMQRAKLHQRSLVKDEDQDLKVRNCNDCGNLTVIDTNHLVKRFDYDPGFRVVLTYAEDVKNSFEAIFLWIRPWEAHKKVEGNQSLFFPFDNPAYAFDYVDASEASAEYDSRFWDLEFNYWHHFSPRYVDFFCLSGIAGLRYFHLNESFKLTFVKPPDTSDYSIHTENDIFGAQLGLNLQMAPTSRLSWDLNIKGGAMVNRAKQRDLLQDLNNTLVLRRYNRQKWQRGLFADFLGQVGYQFKEPLNLHAGYEFLILSGVALAPEQIENDTGPGAGKPVYTDGFVYIYGWYVGATFSF